MFMSISNLQNDDKHIFFQIKVEKAMPPKKDSKSAASKDRAGKNSKSSESSEKGTF